MKHLGKILCAMVATAIVLLTLRIYFPEIWVNTSKVASLDGESPFHFTGRSLVFQDQRIALGPKAFFVDASLSDKMVRMFPYVYNDIREALTRLPSGTEAEPAVLYIAPNVYWIDDPDDPEIRRSERGGTPYGMVLDQSWISLYGLSAKPENVVLACNRGQTQGADGNFTMFRFTGNGIHSENITFGNYCNVDLVYPLKPELGREKRMSAITQAQLITCNSDKVTAVNCSFVSRLNMCPFVGARRALFERCHFECTDDALCGNGVYVGCDLDFYSSKPFWSTQGTGAAFMDCDFLIRTDGVQYLTKVGAPVALIDCRFHHEGEGLQLQWTPYPRASMRSYQYNVTLNGQAVTFNEERPEHTVDMEGKRVLNAYRIDDNGQAVYNLYGLLRGTDDWDPTGQKQQIEALSQRDSIDYADIPTLLRILPDQASIETGVSGAGLTSQMFRFSNAPASGKVSWYLDEASQKYAKLVLSGDTCHVYGANFDDRTRTAIVKAATPSGIEAAAAIEVRPRTLAAPEFIKAPYIHLNSKGNLFASYQLNLRNRSDQSLITWYRCRDARGREAIPVAVSRLNVPELVYPLTRADVGYYIMVKVEPKHIRSLPGEPMTAITAAPVQAADIKHDYAIHTNFRNFPTQWQPRILPGFWTVDGFKPADTKEYSWLAPSERDTWFYGKGQDGAVGNGLLQQLKGARLLYTPVEGRYGNMDVSLVIDPSKTAGQGFGSATGQYLDIYIKFDTRTLTGYALRIVRTTKYANAVDFVLMKYSNGETEAISRPVSATCFRTGCHIDLRVRGNELTADVTTTTPLRPHSDGLPGEVHLSAPVEQNDFGGTGIQHTGSVGASAIMLHQMDVVWR